MARPFCWYQDFWLRDLDLDLTFFWKKLNLGHNFWTKRDRAFIFHMWISYGKTFLSIPKFLTLWPWPWLLTYFWKNLTLAITFEPKEIGLPDFTCVFLMARPFCWYQDFWLRDLDLDFWPSFEKNLTLAITFEPIELGLSYFTCGFLMARPFCRKQFFLPRDLDLDFWPTFEKTFERTLVTCKSCEARSTSQRFTRDRCTFISQCKQKNVYFNPYIYAKA